LGSAARVSPAICGVSGVTVSADSRTQTAEEREQMTARASHAAISSAIKVSDALSARGDKT